MKGKPTGGIVANVGGGIVFNALDSDKLAGLSAGLSGGGSSKGLISFGASGGFDAGIDLNDFGMPTNFSGTMTFSFNIGTQVGVNPGGASADFDVYINSQTNR